MCAYNRFRGEPACGSRELLETILRGEWGFTGYVVSDCGAITDIYRYHNVVETAPEAAAMGVASGTDLNCGSAYENLTEAIGLGLLTEEELDVSVRRLFEARMRLGMFDPPGRVPYSNIPYSVNDSEEHGALALEATRKSLVLLKNADDLLPLGRDLGTIAVIGPNADDTEVLLGNYNGIPSDPVTPLRGIREKVAPGTEVVYARGSDLAENLPFPEVIPASVLLEGRTGEGRNGLRGEYFGNPDLEGEPSGSRADEAVDFAWFGEGPMEGLSPGDFSVRWEGSLIPPVSGRYSIGVRALGRATLSVDGERVATARSTHSATTRWTELEMEAGVPHEIGLEFRPVRPDAMVQLVWAPPEADPKAEAIEAAQRADAVVLFLGLSPRLEGEEMRVAVPGFQGGDRVEIGLPDTQQDLLEAVVATGKPVVLVLLNGSALAIPWAAENVPAILEAWYPGQAAGAAIADVLFGDHNPAGRLPVTVYRSVDQLPPFEEYAMEGRTYRYFGGDPLFPFGHGLSYTSFAYRGLELPEQARAEEGVEVAVEVENTGPMAGEEVVQLYVTDLQASAPVSVRSLQGFRRIALDPGERRRITFTLEPRQLSIIDNDGERVVEPGLFEISVGGKQPGFGGVADAATTGVVVGRFEVVGEPFRLER
jgi:beta-glucosidase